MTEQCSGFTCPVEATISLIGGKYKAVILWHLMNNTLRYSELHRKMPKATDKMLAPHTGCPVRLGRKLFI